MKKFNMLGTSANHKCEIYFFFHNASLILPDNLNSKVADSKINSFPTL